MAQEWGRLGQHVWWGSGSLSQNELVLGVGPGSTYLWPPRRSLSRLLCASVALRVFPPPPPREAAANRGVNGCALGPGTERPLCDSGTRLLHLLENPFVMVSCLTVSKESLRGRNASCHPIITINLAPVRPHPTPASLKLERNLEVYVVGA